MANKILSSDFIYRISAALIFQVSPKKVCTPEELNALFEYLPENIKKRIIETSMLYYTLPYNTLK